MGCRGAAIAGGRARVGRGQHSCPTLLLNPGADIGHVDFLEKVHSLAERPYVIAGLHFDQVTPGQLGVGPSRGFWGWGWAQVAWRGWVLGVTKTEMGRGLFVQRGFPVLAGTSGDC